MPLGKTLHISCNSLSDTKTLAGCFASYLSAGLVVGLHGPLGVGKSAFARFVIQASCGDDIEVPSPTFTLVQSYQTVKGLPLMHMDLYRLEKPEDALALGVEDSFFEAANLVEWPDKMGGYWPDTAIEIAFAFTQDEGRDIKITGHKVFCDALYQEANARQLAVTILP